MQEELLERVELDLGEVKCRVSKIQSILKYCQLQIKKPGAMLVASWTMKNRKADYNTAKIAVKIKNGGIWTYEEVEEIIKALFNEIRKQNQDPTYKKVYVGTEESVLNFLKRDLTPSKYIFHYKTKEEGVITLEYNFNSKQAKVKGYYFVANEFDRLNFAIKAKEDWMNRVTPYSTYNGNLYTQANLSQSESYNKLFDEVLKQGILNANKDYDIYMYTFDDLKCYIKISDNNLLLTNYQHLPYLHFKNFYHYARDKIITNPRFGWRKDVNMVELLFRMMTNSPMHILSPFVLLADDIISLLPLLKTPKYRAKLTRVIYKFIDSNIKYVVDPNHTAESFYKAYKNSKNLNKENWRHRLELEKFLDICNVDELPLDVKNTIVSKLKGKVLQGKLLLNKNWSN